MIFTGIVGAATIQEKTSEYFLQQFLKWHLSCCPQDMPVYFVHLKSKLILQLVE